MTWQDAEHDPEEAERVRKAVIGAAALTQDALRGASPASTYEHAFLRRDVATYDAVDLELLNRLAWHYRRRLPRHLRRPLNPDDPIVRQFHTAA